MDPLNSRNDWFVKVQDGTRKASRDGEMSMGNSKNKNKDVKIKECTI